MGIRVPLPDGAVAEVHDAMREHGGSDEHSFAVDLFSGEDMLAIYLPWAKTAGFSLKDRIEGFGDYTLIFRNAEGVLVTVSRYAKDAATAAMLTFTFRQTDETDADTSPS